MEFGSQVTQGLEEVMAWVLVMFVGTPDCPKACQSPLQCFVTLDLFWRQDLLAKADDGAHKDHLALAIHYPNSAWLDATCAISIREFCHHRVMVRLVAIIKELFEKCLALCVRWIVCRERVTAQQNQK